MRRFFTTSLVLTGLLFLAHMSFPPESPAPGGPSIGGPAPANQGQDAAEAQEAAESGSEAAQAAAEAAEAAEAAKASKEAVDAAKGAGGTKSSTVSLGTPGQGVTAGRGHSPSDGVSDKDRASLDQVGVNPNAWSPY